MALCCSLQTWTSIAVFYTLIDFVIFTVVDILILIALRAPIALHNYDSSWNLFVDSFREMDNQEVLIALLSARLAIRFLMVFSVPILFVGNRSDRRRYMIIWEIFTAFYIVMLIADATYFLIIENKCGIFGNFGQQKGFNNSYDMDSSYPDDETKDSLRWSRLTMFLNLTDSGIFLVLYILFLCAVHLRAMQISHTKVEMKRFEQWDATITPYQIPRARLNSLIRDENTLELRSCRGANTLPTSVNFQNYPTISRSTNNIPPYYDNYAFKY